MATTRPFRLGRAAPTIPVSDIDAALSFYVGVLGMSETFRNGEPVGFVIVEKDAAEIHLTLRAGHRATTANVAHLMVDDARSLYAHLASTESASSRGSGTPTTECGRSSSPTPTATASTSGRASRPEGSGRGPGS
jgi:hypothetical protein